jgi:glutamine phosphoribosylpyrophosphate amidotransferase
MRDEERLRLLALGKFFEEFALAAEDVAFEAVNAGDELLDHGMFL